jgi:hypothetical protein
MNRKNLSIEDRKQRTLAMIQDGGLERLGRLQESMPQSTPAPATAPASEEPIPLPKDKKRALEPVPDAPRIRRNHRDEEVEDDGKEFPPPSEPESFGIQESRKGLKARGWVPKNTLFHPREIANGMAFAADLGLEWSEFCNLAIALVMDPKKRTESTDDLLLAIRNRRSS